MARRQPLWKHLWLPLWQGTEPLVRAAESLLIKSFRPNANFVPQPAVSCGRVHRMRRRRPPKFVRLQQRPPSGFPRTGQSVWSSQLWDNALSNAEILLSKGQYNNNSLFWSMSFHEAFRFRQQILWVAFGQLGLVNIYESGRRRLVALWLTCKHPQLDLPCLSALWACDSVLCLMDCAKIFLLLAEDGWLLRLSERSCSLKVSPASAGTRSQCLRNSWLVWCVSSFFAWPTLVLSGLRLFALGC